MTDVSSNTRRRLSCHSSIKASTQWLNAAWRNGDDYIEGWKEEQMQIAGQEGAVGGMRIAGKVLGDD